jgi:hypothetical protein
MPQLQKVMFKIRSAGKMIFSELDGGTDGRNVAVLQPHETQSHLQEHQVVPEWGKEGWKHPTME